MVLKSTQSATDAWTIEESSRKRDPWFNPYRFPASERGWAIVHEVYGDLKGHEHRKRARRTRDQQAVQETVRALVANLVHHHLGGAQGKGLPVPRAKNQLGKHNRYLPLIFRRTFPELLDQLAKLKYLRQRTGEYSGFPWQSRRTTIRAGTKLVALMSPSRT